MPAKRRAFGWVRDRPTPAPPAQLPERRHIDVPLLVVDAPILHGTDERRSERSRALGQLKIPGLGRGRVRSCTEFQTRGSRWGEEQDHRAVSGQLS
jgi:hypothetical protein